MIVTKATKIRLYPKKAQHEKIDKTLNCCRFIYNHMLSRNEKVYKRRGEHLSCYDMYNLLPIMKDYLPWLKDADSQGLQHACKQVNNAFEKFFKKQTNYPKYKSKRNSSQSYTTANMACFDTQDKKVKLPCLGWIKCSKISPLPDEHKICYFTISKVGNKYYCSITYKYEKDIVSAPIDENQVIGLDYKSNCLYADSNGNKPTYDKYFRKSQAMLAKRQRQLSKKRGSKKGEEKSNRWLKQKALICKLQTHIANQRQDSLHKLSTMIANQYDAVCIEDISIQELLKSHDYKAYHKSTYDNGWYMFTQMLDYKLKDRGKRLVKVDKVFPSSKKCHICGHVNNEITNDSIRKWECPCCHTTHDRDINAAINIKNEGLRLLGV